MHVNSVVISGFDYLSAYRDGLFEANPVGGGPVVGQLEGFSLHLLKERDVGFHFDPVHDVWGNRQQDFSAEHGCLDPLHAPRSTSILKGEHHRSGEQNEPFWVLVGNCLMPVSANLMVGRPDECRKTSTADLSERVVPRECTFFCCGVGGWEVSDVYLVDSRKMLGDCGKNTHSNLQKLRTEYSCVI